MVNIYSLNSNSYFRGTVIGSPVDLWICGFVDLWIYIFDTKTVLGSIMDLWIYGFMDLYI